MDNNKTFIFMIILAFVFVGVNIFFMYNKKNKVDNNEINNTKNYDNQNIIDEKKESKDYVGKFEIINQKRDFEYELIFENDNILIEFTPYGGMIKKAYLKDTFLGNKQINKYSIIDGKSENNSLKLKLGSWGNGATVSELTGGDDFFNFTKEGEKFIFSCQLKDKTEQTVYKIEKIYTFIENENIFKFDVSITNDKKQPTSFDKSDIAYSIGWGPNLNLSGQKFDKKYDHFSYFDGKKNRKVDAGNKIVKNSEIKLLGKKYREGNESWMARNDRYFSVVIYPDNQNYNYFFDYRNSSANSYYMGFERMTQNSVVNSTYYIYLGPRIKSIVKKYDNFFPNSEFSITDSNLSKIVDSILFGLGDIIGVFLNLIYKGVKNYGLAIIILTIIIKLLMSPLTHFSMSSQEKMSKLQPKIKELQEKYKDKPDILNKETMALYKKEGINPLGGCLPMLLQMPILMAMYQLLDKMVELKGSSFLWISDLSLPDAVVKFAFTVPLVNISSLNIMPIVMVGTQVLSSLMMPDVQSNNQTKMMIWMLPIMFFFLFYNVSSGLVLYWTIMNILNLLQQLLKNIYPKLKNNKKLSKKFV